MNHRHISRRYCADNMRRKIKRKFCHYLIEFINKNLKDNGSKKNLVKFPATFSHDVSNQKNKGLFNMTLLEILKKEELYGNNNRNYEHNLRVIESEEILKIEDVKTFINKKLSDLFGDYLDSDKFKTEEIKHLKDKNYAEDYIQKYIHLATNFINFYSK